MTDPHPSSTLPWYRTFVNEPQAWLTCLLSLGAAWYLGPADFGPLQAALALGAALTAACTLDLDAAIRAEVKARPAERMETLGTAMAIRAGVGLIVYVILAMALPAQIAGKSHAVWMVAAIAAVLQAPWAFSLWFEQRPELPRLAQQVGFGVSAVAMAFLIWHGGSGTWFAAATLLQPTLASLILFFAHMRLAPDEETFTWNQNLAWNWLRGCATGTGAQLLGAALFGITPTLVVFSGGPLPAGLVGLGLVYLIGGYGIARQLDRTDEKDLARPETSAAWLSRARAGWLVMAAIIGLAVLLRFTVFRGDLKSLPWKDQLAPLPLILATVPWLLGARRNEIWRREKRARSITGTQAVGALFTLPAAGWAAHQWGALGAALALFVGLVLENLVATAFFDSTGQLARLQWRALFLRGDGISVPMAPPRVASRPDSSSFFTDTKTLSTQNVGTAIPMARDSAPSIPPEYTGLKTHDPV